MKHKLKTHVELTTLRTELKWIISIKKIGYSLMVTNMLVNLSKFCCNL
jgi:hypothetical protein